ncbi:MAG TPA: hypothetical protein VLH12_08525 [Usitatibacter sp.]|nr:hypothetical protein [Usitatibacter sp.]
MVGVIHYHGTPITPRAQLERMAGRNFCVSFAKTQDLKTCLRIGQSVMFDNGAFTIWKQGGRLDVQAYYRWLEPILKPPHWCVIPDEIDGTLEQQHALLSTWPRETFGYENCAPVFHLHMPLAHLHFLCNAYPKVCLGSSGQFAEIGTDSWTRRMDEIFNFLARRRVMPWIHGLRMLGQAGGPWAMASADSTNVAQNWKRDYGCAECKAAPLDAIQPRVGRRRPEHPALF